MRGLVVIPYMRATSSAPPLYFHPPFFRAWCGFHSAVFQLCMSRTSIPFTPEGSALAVLCESQVRLS
jgi:hypothetical protein